MKIFNVLFTLLIITTLLSLTTATSKYAFSQIPCQNGERNNIVKRLKKEYGENAKAIAMAGKSNLIELFVSKKKTWTIIVTDVNGKTCFVAAGKNWEDIVFIEGTNL